jgi:hypothetical protein
VDENTRNQSLCVACGRTDTDPKHASAYPQIGPDRGLQLVSVDRHFDCCAAAACPDGSCRRILTACGYKRGDALREFITSGGAAGALA